MKIPINFFLIFYPKKKNEEKKKIPFKKQAKSNWK